MATVPQPVTPFGAFNDALYFPHFKPEAYGNLPVVPVRKSKESFPLIEFALRKESESVTLGDLAGRDLVFQRIAKDLDLDFLLGSVCASSSGLGYDGLLCGWLSCLCIAFSLPSSD